jgi:hypothetical protein
MILVTQEERRWFLRNVALGLVEYAGAAEPPVQVEEVLRHPPSTYDEDFGVVDMYSNLWDATFARPPSRRGSIFVRIDLPPKERRLALARELLSALISSRHGRALGLADLLLEDLRESAAYFARHLLMPEILLRAFRERGGKGEQAGEVFVVPREVAALRWEECVA